MRRLTLVLAPFLLLALVGGANAKGKKNSTGLKGTIVSVSGKTLTIKTHHKKGDPAGATQMTIQTDANTTVEINGVAGKSVKDLQAGEKVVITGDPTTAVTDIQATSKKHHKKNVT